MENPTTEHVFRGIFRSVKDGIMMVDAKTGAIREGNPSLLKMLGVSRKELLRRKAWKIGFVNGPLSTRAMFGQARRGYSSHGEHLQVRTAPGRRLDVELECAPYRLEDVDVVQCTLHDITERLRLQTALEDREERYRNIFDNSRLGIAIISTDLRVTKINHAFTLITGYDEADMRRLSLADITHPNHLAADRTLMRSVRRCLQNDYHVEKRYIGKLGNVIWTNTHIGAVCDKDGALRYMQAIIEDITERKLIEAELKEKNIRIIEKERTIQALKDEFIFIAAHELRSPVTAINWSVEMLKEAQAKNTQTPDAQEAMDVLGANARRLADLVSELLEVSRMEYGTFKIVPTRFSLTEAIDQAVATIKPTADAKSIVLKVLPATFGPMRAFADPGRVREVLVNLLTNAIKYNHPGGVVTISVKKAPGELHVIIGDNGFGLDAADITKLFQRFSRIETSTTKDVEGTGLGLFIVRQVVDRMGGKVWVESPGRGKGSTFTFSLPKTN